MRAFIVGQTVPISDAITLMPHAAVRGLKDVARSEFAGISGAGFRFPNLLLRHCRSETYRSEHNDALYAFADKIWTKRSQRTSTCEKKG